MYSSSVWPNKLQGRAVTKPSTKHSNYDYCLQANYILFCVLEDRNFTVVARIPVAITQMAFWFFWDGGTLFHILQAVTHLFSSLRATFKQREYQKAAGEQKRLFRQKKHLLVLGLFVPLHYDLDMRRASCTTGFVCPAKHTLGQGNSLRLLPSFIVWIHTQFPSILL